MCDKRNKPKMVIHCASGINNSGDEAILEVIADRYREEYDLKVISLDKNKSIKYHPNIEFYSNGDSICDSLVRDCDVFVLGGGGLLQDETSIFNTFRWLKYLKIAIDNKKFTMLYANSIGPLNYSVTRSFVKKYLQKVNLITVRDQMSKELLHSIGVTENVYITADPVFSFKFVEREGAYEKIKQKYNLPEQYVCISIRHWFDTIPFLPVSVCVKLGIRSKSNTEKYKQYIENITKVVDYCNEKLDLPVVFVSMLVERDAKPANDVLANVKLNRNIVIDDVDLLPLDIMEIINHSNFLVGMRLHSIIYAMRTLTPVIILSYSNKVKAMAKKIELQDMYLDISNFSFDKFCEICELGKLEESAKRLEEIRKKANEEEKGNVELLKSYRKV